MARQYPTPETATCPYCGKRSFTGRKAAKTAMRRAHPNDKMSIYKCRRGPDGMSDRWHYGHLAEPVKHGLADRDTVYSGRYRAPNDRTDKRDVLAMPSIAEMANIKPFAQNIRIPEPTAPALTQARFAYNALKEFVQTPSSGFERYNKDGIDGWIGHLSLKPYIEDLIPPKADWNSHQKHSRTRAVSEMLNRHKVVICLDHSGKLQGVKPTYFVASNGSVLDSLTPGKTIDPPADSSHPVSKTIKKKSRGGTYTKGYDRLQRSVSKILKDAYEKHEIAVLGHELYDLADFSGLIDAGKAKPSQGGFYTWMRERASRGEFSYRMETDAEFNARPNTQGGRKTYYYAPKGVEVPSMSHGETLSVYLAEEKAETETTTPVEALAVETVEPVTPAVTAEPVIHHTATVQDAIEAAPRFTNKSTLGHLIAAVQALSADADPEDAVTMRKAAHHLGQAVAALAEGSVQNG